MTARYIAFFFKLAVSVFFLKAKHWSVACCLEYACIYGVYTCFEGYEYLVPSEARRNRGGTVVEGAEFYISCRAPRRTEKWRGVRVRLLNSVCSTLRAKNE